MLTGPSIGYPLGGRVDALIARWARDTPEATALTWRGRRIGYLELCRTAEAERRSLAAQGVGRGDVVAVRLPRGPHLVAVLLGVLATGAAYAGSAMDWPQSRFDDIVARCGAKLVIDEHTSPAIPADRPLRGVTGGPADPCCVFSTSGSSGRARAVLTPHSGTTRIALDPLLGMDSGTHLLQISPLGWDAHSLELWGPLINGGTSALYDGDHPGAQELRRVIAGGVDTVWLTTSLFNALVEADVRCLDGLRCVLTGGEKISPPHVALLRAAAPELRIINGYGPVESTIFATAYEIPETVGEGEIPIGVPIANTRVFLENDEIVLAGDGLGTGYLGEPEVTAERFRAEGYHTGDLGRVDERGLLHFTGRTDRQLKIRGARIVPEEVEAAMNEVPGVHRSVLLAAPNGTETLACYVGAADPAVIRARLAGRFPAAFVPRIVHRVDAMPTTANGKTDTGALLALAVPARASVSAGPATAPAGTEAPVATVVRIAAHLLGTRVGEDTDLIDAGADSITVIRLAGRLRLRADTVLAHRTPAAIAAAIPGEPGGPRSAEPDPTRWVAGLPITQYRMWWAEEHRPGAAELIHPLLFEITGPLDTAACLRAVRAVAVRHEALHSVLRRHSHRFVEAVPTDRPPECANGEFTEDAVNSFCAKPFDLAAGPPLRAAIFRRGENDHLLAVAIHRVAIDGASESVFCRDLSTAYTGAELRPAPGFRAVAREEVTTAPAPDPFWHEHLRGVPDLPLDPAAEGANPVTDHPLALIPASTAEWLAAWVQALRAETGAADFALRMPLFGRTLPAADDVIGCFATSAFLRFPGEAATFDDCVEHATTLLARLLTNQHVPIEQLAAQRAPNGRAPVCQAVFSLQNTEPASLTLPGATARRIRLPSPCSAMEVALEIHPGENRALLWHRPDALPAERAVRLADRWREILRSRRGAAV
ncbi:hypothetical protein DMA12_15150 [Amycolatopsis balhimycina DSM 5908]|uniref:Carrier domain-containing protein n=1 Tax=Amycolatopsis balhimycina DSM 5908 TaxID=1081091 RepID=A0A428WP81_AMYBA|nr:AMP-binding protein [Amycolatopsis balhimycina]RSM44877.1 hypothetical protein DMA12_15150 [Amycolatopsis balhimycina DSM 5908]